MKLFLRSAGFANRGLRQFFIDKLDQPIADYRLGVIALVRNEKEKMYADASRRELEDLGFLNPKIINLHETDEMDDFDIVYVCGGNTFAILEKLRERGFDKKITKLVHAGSLYVGVSAGSIIAGKSIQIAGWGSEGDLNEVELENLDGLHLTNVAVFPHYHEHLKSEVESFRAIVDYPVIEITNEQMVYVEDDKVLIV